MVGEADWLSLTFASDFDAAGGFLFGKPNLPHRAVCHWDRLKVGFLEEGIHGLMNYIPRLLSLCRVAKSIPAKFCFQLLNQPVETIPDNRSRLHVLLLSRQKAAQKRLQRADEIVAITKRFSSARCCAMRLYFFENFLRVRLTVHPFDYWLGKVIGEQPVRRNARSQEDLFCQGRAESEAFRPAFNGFKGGFGATNVIGKILLCQSEFFPEQGQHMPLQRWSHWQNIRNATTHARKNCCRMSSHITFSVMRRFSSSANTRLGLRPAEAAERVGSVDLFRQMRAAGWIKPVIDKHKCVIFDSGHVAQCWARIIAGELPNPKEAVTA